MFWVWWPIVTWTWPGLDLYRCLVSNIYSISSFPYGVGVPGECFGPKLLFFRSLRPVTWKLPVLTFDLALTWHVTSFWILRGALRPSHRELSNTVSLASLRSAVLELRQGASDAPPPPSQWKVAGYPSQCRVKGSRDHPILEKSCYIRGGCVPMNKFDATDYESALCFSENCQALETSSFEIFNNYWLRDLILTSFQISWHCCQSSRQLLWLYIIKLRIKLESCWDMNKHFVQGSPINRYAESSCDWGVWRFTWPYMV